MIRIALAAAILFLAACSSGDVANKPSDAGEALDSMAPAATSDNEAAATAPMAAPDATTDYLPNEQNVADR